MGLTREEKIERKKAIQEERLRKRQAVDEAKQKAIDDERKRRERVNEIIVTTEDLNRDYEVIGPIYYQISNKGFFSSALSNLTKKYKQEIEELKSQGQLDKPRNDWGFLYGEFSVGQNDFDKAFFISVQEIKERAYALKADAIIGMKQDIDLDTNAFAYFYLQMYGTAVRFKNKEE